MNDSDIISSLRDAFADTHLRPTVGSVLARGQVLRRWRRIPALVLVAVAVSAGAVVAGAQINHMAPERTTTSLPTGPRSALAAWTVTEGSNDVIHVTVRQMGDIAGLQARLRADGVPAVVTSSLALPTSCSNWRHGRYDMGNVITDGTRTGLPQKNGTEFSIRTAIIPHGAILWLGLSQTGAPAGSPGPTGPTASGYMADTPACYNG
jgi:hypothetical protein